MNRSNITFRIVVILIALNIFGMALLYVNSQRIQDNIVYEFNQVAAQEGITLPQGQIAQAQAEAALETFLVTLLVIVVICCVTGLALHRSLRKLKYLQENMRQIGAGKLDGKVSAQLAGKDEIGRLINTTAVLNERLRQIVYPLFFSSSRLTGNAGFLKDVSVSGMKKMEGVTAELNQVGADLSLAGKHLTQADKAVEEISAASSLISEQAHNLQYTYLDLAEAVKSGRNEMKKFEEIGQVLSEKGKATVHKAQELEAMSNDIGNITATIMNVSTQTNLLALNAAIESARAGEQGRGFAIVAEEVRKLAAETSDYASQISSLIAGVQNNIHLFAQEIDSMGTAIEEESQSTQVVTATMDKIITQIEHVQEVVLDISGITQEQNASSQAVSTAVTTVNENMNHLIEAMVKVIEAVNRQITENFSSIISISEDGNVIVEDLRGIISSYTLPDEVILRQVINDHIVFVRKYEFIINKDLYFDEAEIPDHYACRLGRWIATVKDEKILKMFNEMIDGPHHQVHSLAREAVILNNAGRQAEAQAKVAEMIAASQKIVKSLENFIANLEKL